jgi:hypothetical protein
LTGTLSRPSGLNELTDHDQLILDDSQLDFVPPFRPAAAFCARLPPLPGPLLLRL